MSQKNRAKIQLKRPMMYGWFEYGAGWHEVYEDLAKYFLERKPSSAVPFMDGSDAKEGSITPSPRTAADDREDIIRDIRSITGISTRNCLTFVERLTSQFHAGFVFIHRGRRRLLGRGW